MLSQQLGLGQLDLLPVVFRILFDVFPHVAFPSRKLWWLSALGLSLQVLKSPTIQSKYKKSIVKNDKQGNFPITILKSSCTNPSVFPPSGDG